MSCYGCFFCEEDRFVLNQEIGVPGKDSVVYENSEVYVTPDIAPLLNGHLLIISKEHLLSFGSCKQRIWSALEEAVDYLRRTVYEDIFFFEHGAVVGSKGGACIDHAHMHVIPNQPGILWDKAIDASGFISSPKQIADHALLHKMAMQDQPYIFGGTNLSVGWVYHADHLPSQFFRKVVANHHRVDYNWKMCFREDASKSLFMSTLELVHQNKKRALTL